MTEASHDSSASDIESSARAAARKAKREGERLATGAMAYAEDVAEERKNQTADYIHSLSAAILSGGQSLENEGYGTSANFVEQVAEQIGGLADQLADREPRELLREVERFARERPALFLGGALLAGIGISRFLKSTSPAGHSAGTGSYREPGADSAQRSHPEAFS